MNERWKWGPGDIKPANDNKSLEELGEEESAPEVQAAVKQVLALPPHLRETLMADMRYYMLNQERTLSTLPRSQEIEDFIETLGGFKSSETSVRSAREAVVNFTLENLVDGILDSGKNDWTIRPSHFLALTLECYSRLKRLNALIPKDGK